MSCKIMILNGSPRRNGNTSKLIAAFADGARHAGHEVREFYLHGMHISGCLGCLHPCRDTPKSPCAQKDDMDQIYAAFAESDIIVFASPVYFWSVSGDLKTVADRLYAIVETVGYDAFRRKSVLLTTNGGGTFDRELDWYHMYEIRLGWPNLGEICGVEKTDEAYRLGASIR